MSDNTHSDVSTPPPSAGLFERLMYGRLPVLAPHTWITALIGVFIVGIGAVVAGTIFAAVVPQPYSLIAMGVTIVVLSIVIYALSIRRTRASDLGLVRGGTIRAIIVGVVLTALFNVIYSVAAKLDPALAQSSGEVLESLGFGKSKVSDLVLCFSIVVMAPLWEEVVFRAVTMRAARDGFFSKLPRGTATLLGLVVSSFAFMSAHGGEGQDKQMPLLFLLGALLGLSYLYTGSLLAPLMLHSMNNTFVMIKSVTTTDFALAGNMSPYVMLAGPVIVLALYVVMCGVLGLFGATDEPADA